MARDIIRLVRPKHWIKNSFVIAPLLFSFQFFNFEKVLDTFIAIVCFSFAASAVYIGNDITDKDRDKKHFSKRLRPIASGLISVQLGLVLSFLLAVVSIGISWTVSPIAAAVIIIYLLINFFYSIYLKDLVLVDVFTIASGYVLRVIMGAVVIQVEISEWIILVTIFLSLFLGFAKRYNELSLDNGPEQRKILGSYSQEMLIIFMSMSAVLTIVIYTFYTIDPVVADRFHSTRLLYSIPSVLFGVFRYFQLVVSEKLGGDVVEVVTRDKYIMLAVGIWVVQIIWAFRW